MESKVGVKTLASQFGGMSIGKENVSSSKVNQEKVFFILKLNTDNHLVGYRCKDNATS